MATRKLIQLFDDLDGQAIPEGGETLQFGIDGKSYEIDLAPANATLLRETLAPFVKHGRRLSESPRRTRR